MSRTVYLGTSEFAAVVLRFLAASAHRPQLVLTRPDRPRGRGRREAAPPVARVARELEIALVQPADPNDALDKVLAAAPETICVCAYGAIVREPLLSAAPILNVHPSLLPRWRGAAPIERAIIAGDAESGVSIMRLSAGLDSGPVCLRERTVIGPSDSYGSLAPRLEQIGGRLLVQALEERPRCEPQDESAVTYAAKIDAADRILAASEQPEQLERIVRALHPHIGARTPSGLRVLEARLGQGGPAPGDLANVDGELFYGPSLHLLRVQPPGGRPMDGADYLRGHAL
ncbi:MAG: methionyl-tRNA formyltransferase [Solirubrobacteraceae bacterium]